MGWKWTSLSTLRVSKDTRYIQLEKGTYAQILNMVQAINLGIRLWTILKLKSSYVVIDKEIIVCLWIVLLVVSDCIISLSIFSCILANLEYYWVVACRDSFVADWTTPLQVGRNIWQFKTLNFFGVPTFLGMLLTFRFLRQPPLYLLVIFHRSIRETWSGSSWTCCYGHESKVCTSLLKSSRMFDCLLDTFCSSSYWLEYKTGVCMCVEHWVLKEQNLKWLRFH